MPAGMAKFYGEAKIARELFQKITERSSTLFRVKRWRQLNQDHAKLRREWLDGAKKAFQFSTAIAQAAGVRNFAGQFAGEAKGRWGHFHPAQYRAFRWRAVKGRIDFHCRKIARVKFEPARHRQICRIKRATPFVEAPCACADANFLLIRQVQVIQKVIDLVAYEKMSMAVRPIRIRSRCASFCANLRQA
jgi:hypothetical protein